MTALREWFRKSELSADRAGLLVGQDLQASMRGLMKIAGGNHLHEMNVDAFLEQARQHTEGSRSEGIAKALLFVLYNWQLSHPQVVFRARGLDEWVQSGAYERILGGEYRRGNDTPG